jgi:hypothetical protein
MTIQAERKVSDSAFMPNMTAFHRMALRCRKARVKRISIVFRLLSLFATHSSRRYAPALGIIRDRGAYYGNRSKDRSSTEDRNA